MSEGAGSARAGAGSAAPAAVSPRPVRTLRRPSPMPKLRNLGPENAGGPPPPRPARVAARCPKRQAQRYITGRAILRRFTKTYAPFP